MSVQKAAAVSARRRFVPIAIATGVLGAVLLSVSMSGTLSGFVASITNGTNLAATGALVMQEQTTGTTPVTCLSTDGGTISTNTSTCSTINKFGGSTTMTPGQTVNTAITIKNIGSATATTFTLKPATTCTQSNVAGGINGTATDLCAKMKVLITSGGTTVFSGTAAGLATGGQISLPGGVVGGSAAVPFNFAVTLDPTADNTYQGLQASLPLTWTFAS